MEIIDERSKVSTVAAEWRRQYCYNGKWGSTLSGDTKAIYEKLNALPASATSSDVAAIIGNDSWAGPSDCNECGEKARRTIQLGASPDYESRTVEICESCLRKALALFEQR